MSMTARLTDERAQAVLNCLSSFRGRNVVPLKQFQRLLGHMASAAAVTPLGLLHLRPLQHWVHSRVPRWTWRHGTLSSVAAPSAPGRTLPFYGRSPLQVPYLMEGTETLCPHATILNHRWLPGTCSRLLSVKPNEWMHLSPFYTRMHGEWLRHAKSTSHLP